MRQPTAIDWVARVRFTIFGGRGFIGRHLVSYLRGCGHEVLDQEASDLSSQSKNLGNVIYSIGLTGDFRSRPYDTVEAHTSLLSRLPTGWNEWLAVRLNGLSQTLAPNDPPQNI